MDERVSPHGKKDSAHEDEVRSIKHDHWLLEPTEEVGCDRLYCDAEEKQKIQPNKNEVGANKRAKKPVVTNPEHGRDEEAGGDAAKMGQQFQDIPESRVCAEV